MALTVVGINHRGAPLEIRERVAYRPSEVATALDALSRTLRRARGRAAVDVQSHRDLSRRGGRGRRAGGMVGAFRAARRRCVAATATCVATAKRRRISSASRAASTRWCSARRRFTARCATRGRQCRAHSGPVLNRLFQTSLLVAGRVRNETSVARGAASVSSAAVQLAKQIFGSLAGKRAMVLGAGEMAELALECLADQGVRAAIVANRTFERATELAGALWRGRRCTTTSAGPRSPTSTCCVCSTAAPRAVVFVEHVRPALGGARRPAAVHPRHRAAARRRSGGRRARERVPLQPRRSAGGGLGESRAPARRAADGRAADRRGGRSGTGIGSPAWRRCRC